MRNSLFKFPLLLLPFTAAIALPSCAQNAAPETALAQTTGMKNTDTKTAATQTADFSDVPGTVIFHSPSSSKLFVGSPGIAVLPNGNYVAKNDEFGFGIEDTRAITRVFGSSDKGKSWQPLSVVEGCFWTSIFVHNGALYMIGTTKQYGHLVIWRSDDNGKSWTTPTDESNGVLRADGKFHTAPVPLVEHDGRIWRAVEDANGPGGWGSMFRAFVMSAPDDADLLKASSWTFTNSLARDEKWNNNDFGGWLEGNAVVTPDGNIVDILRVATNSPDEKAAIVRISKDGKTATFDPTKDLIELPGATKKFTIRYDPQTKKYWSLSNVVPERHRGNNPGGIRNTLGLISSPDLKNWTVDTILLYHPDPAKHGFQYVDWLFDGNDLIAASRTAYDDDEGGAHNNHDANFLTFHRFKNFRNLTMKDAVKMPTAIPIHAETAALSIDGSAFQMAPLVEGLKAFSNRDYQWLEVPTMFKGGQFTQLGGGVAAQMNLRAKKDGTIYLATNVAQAGVDTKGWTKIDPVLRYSDGAKTVLNVFKRDVKAREVVTIPQGSWTGGMVLMAAE